MHDENAKPSFADYQRDIDADLALCNEASPGPWDADGGVPVTANDVPVVRMYVRHDPSRLETTTVVGLECDGKDHHFIAEARTGWPAALRRLRYAEDLNRQAIDLLRRLVDVADAGDIYDVIPAVERFLGGL